MITKEEALSANEFHVNDKCTRIYGPRGGKIEKSEVWRRSGQNKLWKTRPEEFRIPVKYGMYNSNHITHNDRTLVHVPKQCPLNDPEYVTRDERKKE